MSEQGWGNGDAMDQQAAEDGVDTVTGAEGGKPDCGCPEGMCLGQMGGDDAGPMFFRMFGGNPFDGEQAPRHPFIEAMDEMHERMIAMQRKEAVAGLVGIVADLNDTTNILARLVDEVLVNPED